MIKRINKKKEEYSVAQKVTVSILAFFGLGTILIKTSSITSYVITGSVSGLVPNLLWISAGALLLAISVLVLNYNKN